MVKKIIISSILLTLGLALTASTLAKSTLYKSGVVVSSFLRQDQYPKPTAPMTSQAFLFTFFQERKRQTQWLFIEPTLQ